MNFVLSVRQVSIINFSKSEKVGQDSSVNIATGYRLDDRGVGV
jgi:hypothetical protein